MEGEIIAAGVEFVQGVDGLGSACGDLLIGKERVECLDLHAEGLGLGAHQTAHVAECLDAQGLALNFGAGCGSELSAGHENHHCDGKLGHCVGVLAGGVHHHHSVGGGRGEIDIVESCACADDYLKLRSGVEHLGGNFIRTDDEGVDIGDCLHQVGLLGILFEQRHFVPALYEDIFDPCHCCSGKGFLGCNQDFHFLRASNSFIVATSASTSSWVQAL